MKNETTVIDTADNETLATALSAVMVDFSNKIRKKLLNGESVELPGIGVLEPHFRNVKNSMGMNFSIKIWLKHDKSFKNELIKEFKNNPEKFGVYLDEKE